MITCAAIVVTQIELSLTSTVLGRSDSIGYSLGYLTKYSDYNCELLPELSDFKSMIGMVPPMLQLDIR